MRHEPTFFFDYSNGITKLSWPDDPLKTNHLATPASMVRLPKEQAKRLKQGGHRNTRRCPMAPVPSSRSFCNPAEVTLAERLQAEHLDREERLKLQWGASCTASRVRTRRCRCRGFIPGVSTERSDKALDAFDQELREPPDCPNYARILEARG